MTTAIRVTDLVVERARQRVIDQVSFEIPAGSVTGLLGPSGSGKTTLLRAIVGVQRIRSGTIQVLGMPAGTAELRRRVGYVTQQPSVYGDLTVRQNARYFALIQGAGATAADTAIRDVGLADFASRRVDSLSGGQRARVSLACAMLANPDVLILDEPTVGLDPVLRRDIWQQFHALADSGTTLLVSSHVMDEADRCERLLLLREGRLLAYETPDELRATTAAPDLEEAFLRLILRQADPSGQKPVPPPEPSPNRKSLA
ncbi:ABC transporter ATP-binding protein [Nocardia huaxiensis]|uniref:ABC transporter ATP-binding protein n=1 Tax=Nocardia huaxiensis TaxID=2755382 RepID=A0A7D6Z5M2_9NOCA|nr:ABC transporter ATP-binding protein [Nocardia huaxiensis]QLY32044.1 ABC transporter ATP-binding protein [Nocardia huaxiensis]UFS95621.1 ABC transporter ATP-binding protein [Nocardia huaxiensis]